MIRHLVLPFKEYYLLEVKGIRVCHAPHCQQVWSEILWCIIYVGVNIFPPLFLRFGVILCSSWSSKPFFFIYIHWSSTFLLANDTSHFWNYGLGLSLRRCISPWNTLHNSIFKHLFHILECSNSLVFFILFNIFHCINCIQHCKLCPIC